MHKIDFEGDCINRKVVGVYWKEIWNRFKDGDTEAFEIIYNEHVDFLFSYGTKITRNVILVEDTIQDLFLYLLSKKENLTDPECIQYYLLKAFKRILIKKIRQEKSYSINSGEEICLFNLSVEMDNEVDQNLKEKKLELIETLIGQLDPRKKEIIFLKFHSGLSYEEIGRLAGIQPDSAKKLVYRTISSLREIIQDQVFELFLLFSKTIKN